MFSLSQFLLSADIVFLIYLYQRYIYRVDPTRVNEFGVSAEMMDNINAGMEPIEDKTAEEKKED
jgi:hypothetical protein